MQAQLVVLGLAFTLTCGVVYLAVGPRISGASMIILGLALLAERFTT